MFSANIGELSDSDKRFFAAPNKPATRGLLEETLEDLGGLVTGDVVYPDTLALLTRRSVESALEEALKETSGTVRVEPTEAWGYSNALWLHQPSRAAIALTKRLPGHCVSRLDLGVDTLTRDHRSAEIVQRDGYRFGVQRWHGNHTTEIREGTAYWCSPDDDKPAHRNIVGYSRWSKIPPHGPCAHFDLRLDGRVCRRRGIRIAVDLLDLDLAGYLARDLVQFAAVNWVHAGKRLDELTRRTAQRMHRLAARGRLPAVYGWTRLRYLVERSILLDEFAGSDENWPGWRDLVQLPTQKLLEHFAVLRGCEVRIPFDLVRSDRLSFA